MIKVNGEMLEIAEGTTVAAFLKEHGYPDKMRLSAMAQLCREVYGKKPF